MFGLDGEEPTSFGSSRSSCESLRVTLIKSNVRITRVTQGEREAEGEGRMKKRWAWQSAEWLVDRQEEECEERRVFETGNDNSN